jgi:hypothetical protein
MTLHEAAEDLKCWKKLNPGGQITTWLLEHEQRSNPLPPRARTPEHGDHPSDNNQGPWHGSFSQPSAFERVLARSSTSNVPPCPKSPPHNSAFSHADIRKWSRVDWTFLLQHADVFTAEKLAALKIRVAVLYTPIGIDESSRESVTPGRPGSLMGCSDDRLTAIVEFSNNGFQHLVPFSCLCNGPRTKFKDRVVVIRDMEGKGLVGQTGVFVNSAKKLALGIDQYRYQLIADNLPASFANKESALVLWPVQ